MRRRSIQPARAWRRAASGLPALAGAALIAAGCGGGSEPSVASLPSNASTTNGTATTPTPTGGSVDQQGDPGPGRGGAHLVMKLPAGKGTRYSACMRANGEPQFPDPNGSGELSLSSANGIDPGSPSFQRAQRACAKLLPQVRLSPADRARLQRQMLAFSACMRSHGVPSFPDPTFNGDRVGIQIRGGAMRPDSPAFQHAQQACRGKLPGALQAAQRAAGKGP